MERGSEERQRFAWVFVLGWDPLQSEQPEWNVPVMKSLALPPTSPFMELLQGVLIWRCPRALLLHLPNAAPLLVWGPPQP